MWATVNIIDCVPLEIPRQHQWLSYLTQTALISYLSSNYSYRINIFKFVELFLDESKIITLTANILL